MSGQFQPLQTLQNAQLYVQNMKKALEQTLVQLRHLFRHLLIMIIQ